ncbi:Uncharacterised protein [uncultured archaeon]|nr:Uncharacterised protein [uncultured archaeon]
MASCEVHSGTFGTETPCGVSPEDITDKIPTGLHKITADLIDNDHTMNLEIITSLEPPKDFVLYGPNYQPWINETTKSMDLQALHKILVGGVSVSEETKKNATNITKM